MSVTPNQFGNAAVQAGICSADELRSAWSSLPSGKRPVDGAGFSLVLVERGLLTHFQAQRLLQGKGNSLVLGEYVLLDSIGAGGMGQVFKAKHRRMDRLVAIKLLPSQMTQDEAAIKRFEREVRAAAKLSHPNIVIAYDAGHTKSQHFLVMEFVDGQDLSSYVKAHGSLSASEAMNYIIQAARGLAYAHQRGVIHRDIKPANLLLDREGTVKILDMGLARLDTAGAHQDDLTGTGQIMGTVDFMPPEQALDTKSADARADIYSLGITLWYLLTGRPVYEGNSMMAKLLAHREQKIPSLSQYRTDLPAQFDSVFSKMVAKSPEARYQSVGEALHDLELLYSGSTTRATSGSEMSPLSLGARSFGGTQPDIAHGPSTRMDATQVYTAGQLAPVASGMEQTISLQSAEVSTDPAIRAKTNETVALRASESTTLRPETAPAALNAPAIAAKKRRVPRWLVGLGTLGGGSLFAFAAMVMFFSTPNGTLRLEITDPEIEVSVKGSDITIKGAEANEIALRPGEHFLHVKRGDFAFDTTSLVLKKGETVVVKAELLNGQMQLVSEGKVLGSLTMPRAGNWQGWPVDAPAPPIAPFDAAQARTFQEAWASYLQLPVEYTDPIGMKFVLIPPGEFLMGSTEEEVNSAMEAIVQYHSGDRSVLEGDFGWAKLIKAESPRHSVILTRPFYLGVTEVTQSQFEKVTGRNPSEHQDSGPRKQYVENVDTSDYPVEAIGRADAIEFCRLLDEKNKHSSTSGYRLPTESEWEFACRAGTTTSFSSGGESELSEIGWFAKNSEDKAHAVGKLAANPFGLFDMHGNVAEFVADAYDPADYLRFEKQPAVNPLNRFRDGDHLRGGFFGSPPTGCRSAYRFVPHAWIPWPALGVRVALSIEAVQKGIESSEQMKQRLAAETILKAGGSIVVEPSPGQYIHVSELGQVPDIDFSITELNLSADRMTDELAAEKCLHAVRGMRTIQKLYTQYLTSLSIEAFDDINTLSELRSISFNGCEYLDDAKFPRLKDLGQIEDLTLWYCGLSDDGLLHLAKFPSLKYCGISGGSFTGSGLRDLPSMPSLKELTLSFSHFSDASAAELKRFPNLELLSLAYSGLTDDGLANLPEFLSLKTLNVGGNQINGEAFARQLPELPVLEVLYAGELLLTDAGLERLWDAKHLKLLEIRSCPVTGAGVEALTKALPECVIHSDAPPASGWPKGLLFNGESRVQTSLKWDGSSPLTVEIKALPLYDSSLHGTQYLFGNFGPYGLGLGYMDNHWTCVAARPAAGDLFPPATEQTLAQSIQERVKLRTLTDLAVVYDKSSMSLFVNGVKQTSVEVPGKPTSDSPFMIGAVPDASGAPQNPFHGLIQAIRFSNVALYEEDYKISQSWKSEKSTLLLLDFTKKETGAETDDSSAAIDFEIIGAASPNP